ALLVTFGLSSCEKDDDLSLSENIDESYFVEVEMDGKKLVLREGKDGYLSGGQAMKGGGDGVCSEGSRMIITKSQDQKKSFWVSLERTGVNCAQDWSYESGLYQIGSYAYSKWPSWDKAEV